VVGASTESSTPSDDELRAATAIIEAMSGKWQPENHVDTYTARIEQLLHDKAEGLQPEAAEPPPEPTAVLDLDEVLQASVQRARASRRSRRE
jgi:DNA end-binding protein Ku